MAAQIPARKERRRPERASFLGRKTELAQIAEICTTTRVLTLVGAGGVGKSRLLLRLAATLDAAFPDGGGALDVSQLRAPGRLAPAVAAALGAPLRCDEFMQPTLI